MATVDDRSKKKTVLNLVAGAILLIALTGFFVFAFARLRYNWEWDRLWEYRNAVLKGWGLTVLISICALVLSVVLGFLLVVAQRCGIAVIRIASKTYVVAIRGTPLLVQILIAYYVVAPVFLFNNKTFVGILALALFSAAYLAEIFRGGIDSVAKTQVDAARAVGFVPHQIYRYVIIPQAMRRVLPGVAGELVNLIKNSSLLMVIGVEEFTHSTYGFFSATYKGFEGFLIMGVGYLLLTLPVTYLTYYLEKKFRYES